MVTLLPFSHDSAGWLRFLLEVSARGAVVLALTAAVCLALRRASAAVRHLLWTLAIVCLLCPPLLSLLLPAWRVRGVPRLPAPSAGPVHQSFAQPEPGGDARIAALTAAATSLKSSAAPTVTAKRTRGAVERPASGRFPRERIPSLALAVWALGAAIALLPALVGLVCVARLVRRARPVVDDSWRALMRDASAQLRLRRPVRLMCSPLDTVPLICGWRRPVLLLPAGADGWTDERRRLVLLHELAHVKRADCLIQMLGQIACALHWFSPLAWLAGNQLRRQGEQACDDLVLTSGFKGSSYAGHLLEIANTLRRPLLLQAAALAMARPSGLEGRIRAVLDPTRSRQALSRRAAVVAALATTLLLGALATVQGADAGAPNAIPPHGAEREPWQSWVTEGGYDPDRRLEQPLRIEILGRSAVSTLALLSEKTGVSLQVAPKDVETLGDRKLTIIAQGCTLKGIMVQVPAALQECHWDINAHGPQPAYLLHRNGSADALMASLVGQKAVNFEESRRPSREARLDAARQALAMSPEELDELTKTDPLLSAAAKDAEARERLERFLAMPAEKMQQFVEQGRVEMDFAAAPEQLQTAVRRNVQGKLQDAIAAGNQDAVVFSQLLLADLDKGRLTYEDDNPFADCGDGTLLRITTYDKRNAMRSDVQTILPPRLPYEAKDPQLQRLLQRTGMDPQTAEARLAELAQGFEQADQEFMERKRQGEEPEPTDADLHRVVALRAEGPVDPAEVECLLAKETGYSVVADYFTSRRFSLPAGAEQGQPLWKLLYALNRAAGGDLTWSKSGDCLVFHHRFWYEQVPQEVPESLILACRVKLQQQGQLTLDDVAAVTTALMGRKALVAFPSDLESAGLSTVIVTEPLRLYALLSPKQRMKACSADGLPYQEMTTAQREQVGLAATRSLQHVTAYQVSQAVFRVKQSSQTTQQAPGDLLESGPKDVYELNVQFSGRQIGTQILLRPPTRSAQPTSGKP